jgi:KDO2-lipid IV(A) lauroyltransferase
MFKNRLKKLKRLLRYYLIKLIIVSIEQLPVKRMHKLKLLLLKVFPLFWQKELDAARKNLPLELKPQSDVIVRKMLENQILTILEVLLYEKLMKAHADFVTIEGMEHLQWAKDQGKGIIILTGHYCNWEVLGYTLVKMGLPLTVVARAQASDEMTNLMNSYREKRGVEVLMGSTTAEALTVLKNNGTLGLLTDLEAKEYGYLVDFFGKKASFYATPVLLSVRSGATVLPTFVERTAQGKLVVRFETPIIWEKGETMKQRIQKYALRYERVYRAKPEFWCWFHDRYAFAHLGKDK